MQVSLPIDAIATRGQCGSLFKPSAAPWNLPSSSPMAMNRAGGPRGDPAASIAVEDLTIQNDD